jgi:hypothetical protein
MSTIRTKEEAITFLKKSMLDWEVNQNEQKIISLAGMAERWSSTSGGYVAKIKVMDKNIKSLDLMIKRNKTVGLRTDAFEGIKEDIERERKELVKEHGEPKPKTLKTKKVTKEQ